MMSMLISQTLGTLGNVNTFWLWREEFPTFSLYSNFLWSLVSLVRFCLCPHAWLTNIHLCFSYSHTHIQCDFICVPNMIYKLLFHLSFCISVSCCCFPDCWNLQQPTSRYLSVCGVSSIFVTKLIHFSFCLLSVRAVHIPVQVVSIVNHNMHSGSYISQPCNAIIHSRVCFQRWLGDAVTLSFRQKMTKHGDMHGLKMVVPCLSIREYVIPWLLCSDRKITLDKNRTGFTITVL